MSKRPLLLLTSLSVSCVCGAWWLYSREHTSPGDSPALGPIAASAAAPPEPAARPERLEHDAEEASVRQANPAADPQAASLELQRVQRAEFERKYADKSRLELEMAMASLNVLRRYKQKEITDARRAAGQFTRINPTPGVELNLTALTMTEADRLVPNPNRAIRGSVRGGDENGKPYMDLVTVPRGEYPEYDALEAEVIWLADQVNPLKQ